VDKFADDGWIFIHSFIKSCLHLIVCIKTTKINKTNKSNLS